MTTAVPPTVGSARATRKPTPVRIAALAVAAFLGACAVYQLALAAGAPLGRASWGGAHTTLPANLRVGSVVAILVYIAFAAVVLGRAGFRVRWVSPTAAQRGTWIVAFILTLSAVANLLSDSPWEQYLNGPLTLLAAALCFFVAKRGGTVE